MMIIGFDMKIIDVIYFLQEYGDERSHNKMLAAIGALDNKNR